MTPKRLQALWRERWNKPDIKAEEDAYVNGAVGAWGERVSSSSAWALPGLGVIATALFAGLSLLLTSVRFSAADQWWLTFFILATSLFIRRYQIPLATLMLLCFAAISSSRYLYWRFDATLGPAFNVNFFLSLTLWVIELYGTIWFALGLVKKLWPAKESPAILPEDLDQWPTLGVYLLSAGHSAEEIQNSLAALQSAKWPRGKLTVTVVDGAVREGLRSSLTAVDAHYTAFPDETRGAVGLLSQALAQSKADLAVILTAGQMPAADYLTDSVGWFLKDPALGMLCTPKHALASSPPATLMRHLEVSEEGLEVLITRVSHYLVAGGMPLDSISPGADLAKNLKNCGFRNALLMDQAGSKWCLYDPFGGNTSHWRLWVERAHDMSGVYKPLLGFVLLTAPLAYLFTGLTPIKATLAMWAAYALPHLAQGYLLYSRVQSTRRLPLWLEVREAVFSVYLLVLTFFTVIWTEFKQRKTNPDVAQIGEEALASRLTLSDHLLTIFHGLAIITGGIHILQGDHIDVHTLIFFLAWSMVIVLLQAAKLAVAREARQVALQKNALMHMPAMVRLPNNRTLACETSNFPSAELELRVPIDLRLAAGQDLKISVFQQTNEFAFPAQVCSIADGNLKVKVDEAFIGQYTSFGQSVLARGKDWPGWLPGQHVDRITPQWMTIAISWPLDLFIHLIHRFNKKPVVTTAENVNMKWKKKA